MSSEKTQAEKKRQLGMPVGTATAILKKNLLFNLLKRHKENFCFQCGGEISTVNELSVEHKIPWMHSDRPVELFFSLDNVAFSHLHCNSGAARSFKKGMRTEHGNRSTYGNHGCRCDLCRKAHAEYRRNQRLKKQLV